MDPTPSATPEELLRHAHWVRRLARQLVQDPSVAEDVVQQTWLTALERPPRALAGDGAVRSWLKRVATNLVLQRGRGEARRDAREAAVARPDVSGLEPGLVEQVDGQQIVLQELLQLDEPTRTTLLLRFFKDLSAAEIARRQDVPAGTVRSRISRGLEELRERMDARHGGDRAAWCVVLASSLEPPALPLPPAPSLSSGTLLGTVVMKSGVILAVALGTVALTVAGIATLGGDDETQAATATERIADVEPAPPTEPAPVAAPAESEETREPVVEQRQPVAAPAKEKPEVAAAVTETETGPPPGRLVFRLEDPAGNPLADVDVSLLDREGSGYEVEGSVLSDGSGFARLVVPMTSDSSRVSVRFEKAGYAPRGMRPQAVSAAETQIGTVVLEPGVLLTGTVTDYHGAPVVGASVFALDPELGTWPEDQLVRTGPNGIDAPSEEYELVQVTTDDLGGFEVTGPVSTLVRMWAGKDGYRWTWTDPIELVAGMPVQGVRLELEELQVGDRIAGILLDEAGDPLPNEYIQYNFDTEGLGVSSGFLTDDDGRFDHVVMRKAPHTLTYASDAGTVVAHDVEPGTVDLVLQVRAEGDILLVVEDAAGNPVPEYRLGLYTIWESGSSGRTESVESADGSYGFSPPGSRFRLSVEADGYLVQSIGPYDAATSPTVLRATLERAGAIRGIVTRAGEPVAGANVRLWSAVEPGTRYQINGFPSRVTPSRVAEATTDAAGRYELPVTGDGDYVVTAHVEGRAPGEATALGVVGAEGAEGVDIELRDGASLVVYVQAPPGEDPAGVIVGLTDGGAVRLTQRADEDGIVRFDDLRPASWLVMKSDSELGSGGSSSTSSWGNIDYYIPFNCELISGETTEFTLVVDEL